MLLPFYGLDLEIKLNKRITSFDHLRQSMNEVHKMQMQKKLSCRFARLVTFVTWSKFNKKW